MDIPSTATEAAAALIATAEETGVPRWPEPEDDYWTALTRRWPTDGPAGFTMVTTLGERRTIGTAEAAELAERSRRARLDEWSMHPGLNLSWPPVLSSRPLMSRDTRVMWPPAGIGQLAAEHPAALGVPLAETRAHDGGRLRLGVLAGPEASPTPHGTWALTTSVLGARRTADQLGSWAGSLDAKNATRARNEARVYHQYADTAEALIPASAGWLAEVSARALAPAFPTVPATVRGHVALGDTTE